MCASDNVECCVVLCSVSGCRAPELRKHACLTRRGNQQLSSDWAVQWCNQNANWSQRAQVEHAMSNTSVHMPTYSIESRALGGICAASPCQQHAVSRNMCNSELRECTCGSQHVNDLHLCAVCSVVQHNLSSATAEMTLPYMLD